MRCMCACFVVSHHAHQQSQCTCMPDGLCVLRAVCLCCSTTLMSEMDAAELLAGQADDFAMDKLLHTVMSLSR